MERVGRLDRGDGVELKWAKLEGVSPTIVFLPGLRSKMASEKGKALLLFCTERKQSLLRFDYSGHGASGGDFLAGSIDQWAADAMSVIGAQARGESLILVGSSMGGWIALLTALKIPDRVCAIVGVAAAPDFTARRWESLSADARRSLACDGFVSLPSRYGDAMVYSQALLQEGRGPHLLLEGASIPLSCPIRLLHGLEDEDVPWDVALRIARQVASPDVAVTLIKDGNHRLSRPQDLDLLARTLAALLPVPC